MKATSKEIRSLLDVMFSKYHLLVEYAKCNPTEDPELRKYQADVEEMHPRTTCLGQMVAVFRDVTVSAGIKHPHYCRFCRRPPGRGRGRYSTRDSIFCLAEPRWRRYHQACAKWSSSRRRSIGRARRSWCRTAIPSAFIVCATSSQPSSFRLIRRTMRVRSTASIDSTLRPNRSARTPETLAAPMFLFMLTAREGRVSANRFALRLRCCLRRAILALPAHLCVSRRLPPGLSGDKAGNSAGILYRH